MSARLVKALLLAVFVALVGVVGLLSSLVNRAKVEVLECGGMVSLLEGELDEIERRMVALESAREACLSIDPTANLTANKYLDYLEHGWICEEDAAGGGSCSEDAVFDSMMRDICGMGWKIASDEWAYWESEARQCQCKLDRAVGKSFSLFEPRAWGGCR